ncbi:MAG: trehalose-phosphatase [Gemmatimonadota bacterium]
MRKSETTPIGDLPRALERRAEIAERIGDAVPAVFLDYDGTLTPIVDDPRDARLPSQTREAIERLKELCPLAIVSGRDRSDVRELVGVDGIHYAGSHGFDIVEADGTHHRRGEEYVPALGRAATALERRLEDVEGAWVERKGFAVAVHFRKLADPTEEERIEQAVDEVLADEPKLRRTGGKKIIELRPDLDWDKGKAILSMLDLLESHESKVVPIYVGDDVTDEDGFRALKGRGIGVVVEGEDDRDSAADYALADPGDARRFLELVAEILSESASTDGRVRSSV